jgi:Glycosyltransferase family 87
MYDPAPALNQALQVLGLILFGAVALLHIADHAPVLVTGRVGEVLARGQTSGDFVTFYAAGQLYRRAQDGSPYDPDALREAELTASPELRHDAGWLERGGVKPYKNPPFYLPVLGLLARFSLPEAFVLSTALQAGLLGLLLALTAGLAAGQAVPLATVAWIVLTLAYDHIWDGFVESQIPATLVGLAFAAGIVLLRTGWPTWAGLVWTLLAIKPQYVPALPLFLVATRQWQALVGFVAGGLALALVSTALIGLEGMRLFVTSNLELATAPPDLYFANYEWMFNWRALLERALAGRAEDLVFPLQLVLIALTFGLALWAWTAPTRGQAWRRDTGLVVLGLTLVLANPHVHSHDLIVLVPVLAVVIGWVWRQTLPWPIPAAAAGGLLLFYWLLPQEYVLSPSLNSSVLLLAALFGAAIALVRGRATAPRRWPRPRTASSEARPQPAHSRD